ELIRRQAEIVEVLRAEVKRNNLIPNIDNILPADGKLVEHLVMVGGTNLGPTLGYDASLQQSIDDALDTAGPGYRPNWPSFCWCHDLYTAIGQIKAQNFASWEEYYSAALQDITVDFYVGEFDKQTVAESRNFYKNLSDKNENMNYYLIEGSDHDVFSNTASNRDRYSPVPAMYKLMSRTQQLVNVVGDNIGQLKFAARVGSGVVLPQENTQP
ncbi:MAG: hypothetical protein J6Y94_05595, partial [Bacteriovoracaceae bacterium]|nr:hypothetical protein [Bacteriovoracaceae bacterium]